MASQSSHRPVVPGLVSTVIPVYNRAQMLVTAVESVLAQTYRPIEIIIADDGSTDDTAQVAESLVTEHPDVIRYARHENAGPGPARELGRQHASGEYIQYLDSDDRLLPNKFADQVAALGEHPECGIAYGVTRLVESDGKVLSDPFKWTDQDIPELFPGLLIDRWWCTHTPLYRRSVADEIGPWCDMRWSQDWQYDSRAGALGIKLIRVPTHVSEHVHHEGVRQTSSASWTTDPVRLRNRLELLETLWTNVQKAGTDVSPPEFQHFSRWCFSIARQCAAQGLADETTRLLTIAHDAANGGPGKSGLSQFELARKVVGTRLAGKIFRVIERMRSGGSAATMDQSF